MNTYLEQIGDVNRVYTLLGEDISNNEPVQNVCTQKVLQQNRVITLSNTMKLLYRRESSQENLETPTGRHQNI